MNLPRFEQAFQEQLTGDPVTENTRRQVENAAFSSAKPVGFPQAKLIAYSRPLAEEFGFDDAFCQSNDFLRAFSGSQMLPGMKPYAMCYGGHQFGHWAGQLGDGRAINLGELNSTRGISHVFQLKGAGPTPYSRSADGFAVLRSSIREFLCSEAMFHLGIPTTRALSLIASGQSVERDMFYNGNPKLEPGAVVARVAPSFIRFGSFEIFAARGEIHNLEQLLRFTITHHYPHLSERYAKSPVEATLLFLRELSEKSAEMIVHWMRVGFVHGVMNTDNMSIIGQTIDYGPYGWLDNFDPHWTPNTTDAQNRRYRYENQAAVTQWNLLQLANALYPVVNDAPALESIIRDFGEFYENAWRKMMAEKLGLETPPDADEDFLSELQALLHESQCDMTLFYRALPVLVEDKNCAQNLNELSYKSELSQDEFERWRSWFGIYKNKLRGDLRDPTDRKIAMNKVNPIFTLRNWVTQLAIDQAHEGDYSGIEKLLEALRYPYQEHPSHEEFRGKRPSWALNKAGCSTLSCSS